MKRFKKVGIFVLALALLVQTINFPALLAADTSGLNDVELAINSVEENGTEIVNLEATTALDNVEIDGIILPSDGEETKVDGANAQFIATQNGTYEFKVAYYITEEEGADPEYKTQVFQHSVTSIVKEEPVKETEETPEKKKSAATLNEEDFELNNVGKEYDGKVLLPELTGTIEGDKVTYYTKDGTVFEGITNAGKENVYAVIERDGYAPLTVYAGKDDSGNDLLATVSITKKVLDLTPTTSKIVAFGTETLTFDRNDYTVTGFIEGEDESVLNFKPGTQVLTSSAYNYAFATDTVEVGRSYVVTLKTEGTDSYTSEITADNYIVRALTKGSLTVVAGENPNKDNFEITGKEVTYDGDTHFPEVTGITKEDTVTYYNEDGTVFTGITDAGSSNVYAIVTREGYAPVTLYTGKDSEGNNILAKVTVNPAELTLTMAADKTVKFGTETINFSKDDYTIEGFVNGEDKSVLSFKNEGNVLSSPEYDAAFKAGEVKVGDTYPIFIELDGTGPYTTAVTADNYLVKVVAANVEVVEGDNPNAADFTLEGKTATYDGKTHTATVTGVTEQDTVTYYVDGTETKFEGLTDAGRENVYAVVTREGYKPVTVYAGKDDEGKDLPAVVIVNPAELTLTMAADKTVKFGTETINFSKDDYTIEGFVNGEDKSVLSFKNEGNVLSSPEYDAAFKAGEVKVGDTYPIFIELDGTGPYTTAVTADNYLVKVVAANVEVVEGDNPNAADFKLEGKTATYDGKTYTATVTGITDQDTVTYYIDGTETEFEGLTNVGRENVYAVVTREGYEPVTVYAGKDDEGKDLPATVIVNPAELTLTMAADKTVKFGTETINFSKDDYTIEGFVNGEDKSVLSFKNEGNVLSSPEYDAAFKAGEVKVGDTYPIFIELDGTGPYTTAVTADNYLVKVVAANVEVVEGDNPNAADFTLEGKTATYDGKTHTATVTGVTEQDTVTYYVDGTETKFEGLTNVGRENVYAVVTREGYKPVTVYAGKDDEGKDLPATVIVNPAELTLTPTSTKTVKFGTETISFSEDDYVISGYVNNEDSSVLTYVDGGPILSSPNYDDAYKAGTVKVDDKYAILVKTTGTDRIVEEVVADNYIVKAVTGTLTVVEGDNPNAADFKIEGKTVTYDGNAHFATVTGVTEQDTVTYYVNGKVTKFEGITNVGSADVYAVVTREGYKPVTVYAGTDVEGNNTPATVKVTPIIIEYTLSDIITKVDTPVSDEKKAAIMLDGEALETAGVLAKDTNAVLGGLTVEIPNEDTQIQAIGSYEGAIQLKVDDSIINYIFIDPTTEKLPVSTLIVELKEGLIVDFADATGADRSKIYDGSPLVASRAMFDISLPNGEVFDESKMSISYYAIDDTEFATPLAEIPSITNVGTTTFNVKVEYEKYQSVIVENISLLVSPKTATIIVSDTSKVEGAVDPTFVATTAGTVGSDRLNYTLSRTAGESVGEYVITATLLNNPNYKVIVENGTLTINPAPVAPVIPTAPIAPTPVIPPIAVAVADAATPAVALVDGSTPGAAAITDTIDDGSVPQSQGGSGAWSLVDLLLAVATAIMSIMLLAGYFHKKKEEEDEDAEVKRKGLLRLFSLAPAIAAVALFIVTQDLTQPMIMIDQWTVLFAVIALVQVLTAVFSKKKVEKYEPTATI